MRIKNMKWSHVQIIKTKQTTTSVFGKKSLNDAVRVCVSCPVSSPLRRRVSGVTVTGFMSPAHLALSHEMDVAGAVGQLGVLVSRGHVVAIVAGHAAPVE